MTLIKGIQFSDSPSIAGSSAVDMEASMTWRELS